MDKYDQLYGRIMEKLNSSKVKNNEEVVSAKFVSDSVSHVMAQYNNVLTRGVCGRSYCRGYPHSGL